MLKHARWSVGHPSDSKCRHFEDIILAQILLVLTVIVYPKFGVWLLDCHIYRVTVWCTIAWL